MATDIFGHMENIGLHHGALGRNCAHLCIDMQRLFAEDTPWKTPWLPRVLPAVEEICARHAPRTVFTRFMPPRHADEMPGMWKKYYDKWSDMTLSNMDVEMTALVPQLARFTPPAQIFSKKTYSPWLSGDLHKRLHMNFIDTLVITGCETEVCVLATVLGAVDLGYRVIVVKDALCSSADAAHDAMMQIYHERYSLQVETVTTQELLGVW